MLSSATRGPLDAFDGLHQLAAHDRELEQVLGAAIDVGAEIEHVGAPFADGIALMMAGRSTCGSILSTKRAVAISAPVLPALTQASASPVLDQIDGDAHRRVLLAAQRLRRRSSMPTVWPTS
jgi:hypothetical protein